MRIKRARQTRHRHSRTSQGGFTLIEVTMALGILSVMVLLNYGIIKSLIESKVEIDDKRQAVYVANSVLSRLTRELELAGKEPKLPPPCDGSNASRSSAVLIGEDGGPAGGKGPSLTFSAKEAGQFRMDGGTHSGAVQLTYRVAPDTDENGQSTRGLVLLREEIPNRQPFALACKDVIRFPITNKLVSLQFKYYDKKAQSWESSWTAQRSSTLPDAIQVSVTLRSDRGNVQTYTTAVKLTP